jgi:hypothetical protein
VRVQAKFPDLTAPPAISVAFKLETIRFCKLNLVLKFCFFIIVCFMFISNVNHKNIHEIVQNVGFSFKPAVFNKNHAKCSRRLEIDFSAMYYNIGHKNLSIKNSQHYTKILKMYVTTVSF